MRYAFFLLVILLMGCGQPKTESATVKSIISPENKYILLLYSNKVSQKYIDELNTHVQNAFPFKTKVVLSNELPVELKSTIHSERYRGDSILHFLHRKYFGKAIKTILITHHDISVTKYKNHSTKEIKEPAYRYKDWAVFGYGSCPGYTCVVSVKRLWARNANEKTFLQRLKNISVHELGHTFGLPHCPVQKCVMNDANETIVTIDKSTGLFCDACSQKLNQK